MKLRNISSEGELRYLNVAQLAARWGVSERTVRRIAQQGKLRSVLIGRQMRFREEDVREYERRNRS